MKNVAARHRFRAVPLLAASERMIGEARRLQARINVRQRANFRSGTPTNFP